MTETGNITCVLEILTMLTMVSSMKMKKKKNMFIRKLNIYLIFLGYGGYDYNAHYGNNYYAYLENLRRTNPAAYAEWYHKYYTSQHPQQHISRGVSNYPEDRASVHSGRSSCEER